MGAVLLRDLQLQLRKAPRSRTAQGKRPRQAADRLCKLCDQDVGQKSGNVQIISFSDNREFLQSILYSSGLIDFVVKK